MLRARHPRVPHATPRTERLANISLKQQRCAIPEWRLYPSLRRPTLFCVLCFGPLKSAHLEQLAPDPVQAGGTSRPPSPHFLSPLPSWHGTLFQEPTPTENTRQVPPAPRRRAVAITLHVGKSCAQARPRSRIRSEHTRQSSAGMRHASGPFSTCVHFAARARLSHA